MSRMGKKPIDLKDGVSIEVVGDEARVKGKKGELALRIPDVISVAVEDKKVVVSRSGENKDAKAKHGMVRSILSSMIKGVTEGFKRELEFQGVGYRGLLKGRHLSLNLGFSNPVEYDVPEGVEVSMPDQTHIVLESIDKQVVGQVAAIIRGFRPPDAYKGKGIRYVGEQISLKEGKTVA
ncbi:MAG: 50S ribosomal protein L6 [Lentisphaeria bacterium]|nr:50S ribosomal protein L6 [Lentisphaeria bacterium]